MLSLGCPTGVRWRVPPFTPPLTVHSDKGSHNAQAFLFHPIVYQNYHRDDFITYFLAAAQYELHYSTLACPHIDGDDK